MLNVSLLYLNRTNNSEHIEARRSERKRDAQEEFE